MLIQDCPNKPNCVSTQATRAEQKMGTLTYRKDEIEVLDMIRKTVLSQKRTKLVDEKSHYQHFTFTSGVFGFVDDVEFFLDSQAKTLHFRSASRVGYSDLGVNRKRMEELCAKLRNLI